MSILTSNLKKIRFSCKASLLCVGEMMELGDGVIILKTYNKLISLTNPLYTWDLDANLLGRKLLPGESVTLTQE